MKPYHQNRDQQDTYKSVKAIIQKRFPKTFNDENPLPLQMGIEKSLMAYFKSRFTYRDLVTFLKQWTGRNEYMKAMAENKHRFNAEGIRVGYISKNQQAYHQNLWAKKMKQEVDNAPTEVCGV